MPVKFEQLWDGRPFVQESGKAFTQTCCDCGSSHNIELTVLNEEEIKVQFYGNDSATATAREQNESKFALTPKDFIPLLEVTSKLHDSKKVRLFAKQLLDKIAEGL